MVSRLIRSITDCCITAEKGEVARAKGEGEPEKEKECTTEGKSRRRRDEKAPWALSSTFDVDADLSWFQA